jgi:hypothetical protein
LRGRGLPQRRTGFDDCKVVLQLALTRLARHYGLDVRDSTPQRRQDIRHWGSEDYRPTLDARRGSGDQ